MTVVAFPKAADLAAQVNPIHSYCPTAINRGDVYWSELTNLCFIAVRAAFQGFPQVVELKWVCPLETFLWHVSLLRILYSLVMK